MRFRKHKNKVNTAAQQPVEPVVCSDIEQISFATFLKCAINHDFTSLIVCGSPSEHQLFIAWVTILSKHYELIGSKDALKYVQMVCKMEKLNMKIQVVGGVCEVLRMLSRWPVPVDPAYQEKLIEYLKLWGYKRDFTDKSLLSDVEFVEKDVEVCNFHLTKAKKEFEAQERQNGRAGKVTKESYMRTLYAIERFVNKDGGRDRLRPEEITLYKFDILYNELVEYNDALKRAHGKF